VREIKIRSGLKFWLRKSIANNSEKPGKKMNVERNELRKSVIKP
jgi:hypothetical protein